MNPWAEAYVSDMLDRSAYQWAARTAIVDGERRLTFAELRERRDSLAGSFERLGITQGTHVGTFLGEGWEHVTAIYALLHAGAQIVPLNLTWEPREIQYALEHADVEVLLTGTTYRGADVRDKLAPLGITATGPVEIASLPRLRLVLGCDRSGVEHGEHWLNSMLERTDPTPPRGTNQVGYIVFTSGSTAFPKGAMIRQDAALGTSHYVGECLGIDDTDRFLNTLPLYHCGGLFTGLLGFHQRGASIHLFEGVDDAVMLDTLEAEQCTAMIGFDLVNMRIVRGQLERGRPVPIKKMQTAPGISTYDFLTDQGIRVSLCYALTESSNFVSMSNPDVTDERGRYSNGRPFPGVEVRISDHETGEPLPVGTPGEITFRGWNQMVGYYRMAERTRAALDADGFLHTGDYGHVDDEGNVFYRGRYAMMIKSGGENVSELEVENFLTSSCDGVVNAAVVGVPDEKWGEIVVAFVETVEPVDEAALRESCRGRLARFKIPKRFFPVSAGEWPLTPTGKLVKNELRERAKELVATGADSS